MGERWYSWEREQQKVKTWTRKLVARCRAKEQPGFDEQSFILQ